MEENTRSHTVDEITMKCRKNAKAIYTKYFISGRERKQLIQELGDAACMLYEYYLRMASKGDEPLTDEAASDYFGWNIHKAKRNRLALIRAGWFRQVRSTYSDGRRGMTLYIGESAVTESLQVRQGRGPQAPRPQPIPGKNNNIHIP